jgi:hypothetical protein
MQKAQIIEMPEKINAEVSQQRKSWLTEGRCPECGELGKLDAFGGARCSTHGVYPLVGKLSAGETEQEDWMKEEELEKWN